MSVLSIVPDVDGITADRAPSPATFGESLTDAGNARRLLALYRDELLYEGASRRWHIWDGLRFRPDETGEIWRRAKKTALTIYEEAARTEDESDRRRLARWAVASENEPRLRSMIQLARSEASIAVTSDDLDSDPYLLTVADGTLDLRTGTLRPADPADRITKMSPIKFDPEAECPTWLRFLLEIFDGDQELVEFDQRWTGYLLTGDIREHCLRIDHGPSGRNGKSVHARVISTLLGDYARTADFTSFMRRRGDGPREDLARLAGARLVIANEAGRGRRLDEAVVKSITGGDKVVARHLYGASFEFRPAYRLHLITNDRPRIDGGDEALWTRIREVPYKVSFRGREDRDLADKLLAEMPGILAWAVRGCLDWQENGLGTAAAIQQATDEYRADEDVLGAFIADRLQDGDKIETKRLRELYESYCSDIGEEALHPARLGRELTHRGICRGGAGRRYYIGVAERGDG
jgi:putative DNA primase/helicase